MTPALAEWERVWALASARAEGVSIRTLAAGLSRPGCTRGGERGERPEQERACLHSLLYIMCIIGVKCELVFT
jgi:hypothetical protein